MEYNVYVYKNFLSKFPKGYKPNESQVKLLNSLEEAFKDHKFVICCAPTGSGKSFLPKTISKVSNECSEEFKSLINSYDAFEQDYTGQYTYEADCLMEPPFGAFVLTITKSLQDQYIKLFEDSSLLKGKTNYTCTLDNNFDVDTAPCILTPRLKAGCWKENSCPYYSARNELLINQFGVLNYKMFLSLPNHVKRKNFLVCDEASELEDMLVSQFSVSIDPEKLRVAGVKTTLPKSNDYIGVHQWLNGLYLIINDHVNDLLNIINSKKLDKSAHNDRIKLTYLRSINGNIKMVLDNWNECEYIIQREDSVLKLTPFKVDNLSKHVFDYADKVLLMSATIIDHKNFAKTLGIKDYKYVEVDSLFDSEKSPIYINTTNRLNHSNLQKNLPKIAQQIQDICELHKNEKGVIHTHSMVITDTLRAKLRGNRFLYRTGDQKNEAIIMEHTDSPDPTVLVSPSMVYGVDLKDDLARFQIIVKASYPPLGDMRIKKMFETDKQWYVDKMLCSFVQACGRGVRNINDHCITYVLDACIYDAVIKNKSNLPKYFLDRFV